MKLKQAEMNEIVPTSFALELGSKGCSGYLGETRRYIGLLTLHFKVYDEVVRKNND
jgi:hypothetical protein